MGQCLDRDSRGRGRDEGRVGGRGGGGGDDGETDFERHPTFIGLEDAEELRKGGGGGRGGDASRRHSQLSTFSTESRHVAEKSVRMGAFNVRRFGRAKMRDPEVRRVLRDLVLRYDLLLVLEVTDATGEAARELLEEVNAATTGKGEEYRMETSPRLGRTKNKEQMVFFYRANRFKVTKSCVYGNGGGGDSDNDSSTDFFRAPFVVRFSTNAIEKAKNIVLIGVHTQPKEAVREISALGDVVKWAKATFRTNMMFILGDLNAGGSYVPTSAWPSIRSRLRPEDGVRWLIPDHVDTTASDGTNAAYDRIVACSVAAAAAVVPGSAAAFRFDSELGLPPGGDLALRVSDHYPVEARLSPRTHPEATANVRVRRGFSVEDVRYRGGGGRGGGGSLERICGRLRQSEDFDAEILYDSRGRPALLEASGRFFGSVAPAIRAVGALRDRADGSAAHGDAFISYSALALFRRWLEDLEEEEGEVTEVEVRLIFDARRKTNSILVEYETNG